MHIQVALRPLSLFQISSIAAIILICFAFIKFMHHQSSDVYVPFIDYLLSFRLAIPPLAMLVSTYVLSFLFGISISDAPKLALRYARNTALQSYGIMSGFIITSLIGSALMLSTVESEPAPDYAKLTNSILSGENDGLKSAKESIKVIQTKNTALSQRLASALNVFEERARLNFSGGTPSSTKARILIRELTAQDETGRQWEKLPIVRLALAEAHSMWVQAEYERKNLIEGPWTEHFNQCIAINEEVAASRGTWSHPLIRYSAILNSGNICFYTQDYQGAIAHYRESDFQNKNLSTAGNLIAAYLCLKTTTGRKEALEIAEKYRQWGYDHGKATSEASQFSSVLAHGGFALLIEGDFDLASEYLSEAYALVGDNLNAATFAVARVLAKDYSGAKKILSAFQYPELSPETVSSIVQQEYNATYYLIRAIISEKERVNISEAICNYAAFLKIPMSKESISKTTQQSLIDMKRMAHEKLRGSTGPESHLLLIPAFAAHFQ